MEASGSWKFDLVGARSFCPLEGPCFLHLRAEGGFNVIVVISFASLQRSLMFALVFVEWVTFTRTAKPLLPFSSHLLHNSIVLLFSWRKILKKPLGYRMKRENEEREAWILHQKLMISSFPSRFLRRTFVCLHFQFLQNTAGGNQVCFSPSKALVWQWSGKMFRMRFPGMIKCF